MEYDHLIDIKTCKRGHGTLEMVLSPGQWISFPFLAMLASEAGCGEVNKRRI